MTEKTLQFAAVYRKVKGIVVSKNHYLLSREKISLIFKIWFPEVNIIRQDGLVKEKQWTPTIIRVLLTVASISFKEKVHFKNFFCFHCECKFY